MLGGRGVDPTIRVTNLERAKRFYEGSLGLKPVPFDAPGHARYDCGGGCHVVIYEGAAPKADHTLATFEVSDIEATARDLRSKGVQFEEYDMPGLKTVNGLVAIGPWRGGWFKDPDGNILAVGQQS